MKLGSLIPLKLRFSHDPPVSCGYAVAVLGSSVYRLYSWIECGNPTPAMITDMFISLDDRFLYISCWHVESNLLGIVNSSILSLVSDCMMMFDSITFEIEQKNLAYAVKSD